MPDNERHPMDVSSAHTGHPVHDGPGEVAKRTLLNAAAWYLPGIAFFVYWSFIRWNAEPVPLTIQTAAWLTMPVPFVLIVVAHDGYSWASASMLAVLPLLTWLPAWLSCRFKWGRWIVPAVSLLVSSMQCFACGWLLEVFSRLARS